MYFYFLNRLNIYFYFQEVTSTTSQALAPHQASGSMAPQQPPLAEAVSPKSIQPAILAPEGPRALALEQAVLDLSLPEAVAVLALVQLASSNFTRAS